MFTREHFGSYRLPLQCFLDSEDATWYGEKKLQKPAGIVYLLEERPRFLQWKESVKCTKRQLCRFARCPLSRSVQACLPPSLPQQQLLWRLLTPLPLLLSFLNFNQLRPCSLRILNVVRRLLSYNFTGLERVSVDSLHQEKRQDE